MGKYNFNYEKLRKIEAENYEMKQQISILRNRILKLEKNGGENAPRQLLPLIDEEVANYLFGWDVEPETGDIIPSDFEKRNCNFTNFYRYIAQAFKPKSDSTTGRKNKFRLRWSNLNDFSESEWNIFKQLIADIVQLIYSAKVEANIDKEEN